MARAQAVGRTGCQGLPEGIEHHEGILTVEPGDAAKDGECRPPIAVLDGMGEVAQSDRQSGCDGVGYLGRHGRQVVVVVHDNLVLEGERLQLGGG